MSANKELGKRLANMETAMGQLQGILQQQLQVIQQLANAYSELANAQEGHYRQVELLGSVFASLDLKHPLPPMRGWAVSPDFAAVVIDLVLDHKPTVTLECGCGVSTLLAAHCLSRNGGGKIIALEHVAEFAEVTRQNLRKHGVEEFAEVRHAPLKRGTIGDAEWYWYDPQQLEGIDDIDLLLVDGPPGMIQKNSRWPALPLLFDRLKSDGLVLLDDTHREDEQEVVQMWMDAWPVFDKETFDVEKGATLLRRKSD